MTEMEASKGKRAAIVWGSVVLGLLGLQIGLCIIGVTLATPGKSYAVESNYYDKAVHWDEQKARDAASAALGWKVQLSIGDIPTERGRLVTLTVLGQDGNILRDAKATVGCFHRARPNETHEATFDPAPTGLYSVYMPVGRPGMWEFRLTIKRADAEYSERIVRAVEEASFRDKRN